MDSRLSTVRNLCPQTTTPEPSNDPLQQILQKLNDVQCQITSLRNKPSQIPASQLSINAEEGEASDDSLTEQTFQEASSVSSHKRDRSPSPINEDVDEDPTYHPTLAVEHTLVGLTIPEEFSEQPSTIFGSKFIDNKRKLTLIPMAMPPVEGVLDRWDFCEEKATCNTQDQPHVLQMNPQNYENYLNYASPQMKFYKYSSNDFACQAPRCQDSFRSTFLGAVSSSVRITFKQHILLEIPLTESVSRSCLMFVSFGV